MTNSAAHAMIHIEASESQPKFHCAYDHRSDGSGSIRISGYPFDIYISGTRAEILDWTTRVRAAAHELPRVEELAHPWGPV